MIWNVTPEQVLEMEGRLTAYDAAFKHRAMMMMTHPILRLHCIWKIIVTTLRA